MNRQELANDAEQSVLGAILLENAAIDQAAAILKPDDFHKESHWLIYQAMLDMNAAGNVIDIITLPNCLKKKELEKVGGVAYLASLVNAVPNAANIKYHCQIVKDHAVRRKLVSIPNIISQEYDLSSGISKSIEFLNDVSNDLRGTTIIPLISSSEFVKQEAESVNWLVQDFIAEGTLNLLAGPSSGYKTWLCMYAGLCVAEGREFLGRPTIKTRVVYVDKENPKNVWRQRMSKLGQSENFQIWPLWTKQEPPSFEKGKAAYSFIAKEKPLMIFDSLIRFHNEEENDAKSMSKVMGQLTELRQAGATVLVLHHMGKDEESVYRGSSEILGGVDSAYTLKRSGDRLHLKGIKNRLILEPNIALRFIKDNVPFSFQDISNEEREKRQEKLLALKELVETLCKGESGKPSQSKIAEAANEQLGIGRQTVLELLKEGEGSSWERIKGRKNTVLYSVLPA